MPWFPLGNFPVGLPAGRKLSLRQAGVGVDWTVNVTGSQNSLFWPHVLCRALISSFLLLIFNFLYLF